MTDPKPTGAEFPSGVHYIDLPLYLQRFVLDVAREFGVPQDIEFDPETEKTRVNFDRFIVTVEQHGNEVRTVLKT